MFLISDMLVRIVPLCLYSHTGYYARFFTYNVIGGIAWVAVCVFGGFWFGNIPIVKNNFELVILIIIFVSVLPVVFHLFKRRSENKIITKPLAEVVEERAN
ncbi:MAG TPA: hypothetical protein DDW84_06650 [Phycisphaerales bacterium]|nr:MAG: hypothetical protein A2Y13_08755 [Planctomycetes bacterium GWC2_45_44]HBG78505.1 hypothetical protein [Phycisphaerales bacterium]HBR20760.1 hypothetical protein [Phycisphaerales bacterium]